MLADLGWVVLGMAVLIFGAERLVVSAKQLARYWGMSTVLIGAVVVGLGTSLPEMLISGLAAARPDGLDLAAGNIVGSNIANLSLVLGVSMIIAPLKDMRLDLRREWTAMWVGSLLLIVLAWNNALSRWDGAVLAAGMVAALVLLYRWSTDIHLIGGKAGAPPSEESETSDLFDIRLGKELALAAASLVLTLWGADRLVEGATGIAEELDISGGLVGLTLVALGTSLPELATAVAAARRRENELVLGNVLGSNLFNALAVGGIAGLVGDGAFTANFRSSLLWMLGTALAAGGLASSRWSKSRMGGVVLVAFYPMALIMAGL